MCIQVIKVIKYRINAQACEIVKGSHGVDSPQNPCVLSLRSTTNGLRRTLHPRVVAIPCLMLMPLCN